MMCIYTTITEKSCQEEGPDGWHHEIRQPAEGDLAGRFDGLMVKARSVFFQHGGLLAMSVAGGS